ncbi:pimeloyl-ACP methyl ester esterase BioH [Permianibacter aggregans]|uniref:Pimeloyl-[acyl-carrier protein] methyl ester esterase n=1 Tax=Permianibacter aggregans TaxID=1510150 RepID=A0A4R6UQV5_9GAMM|nr:pimeloyl-ACP methyl ester esterase BioH [Permianibacter aggregans]QGX40503.1 pimeloyl-[acyl-carrier protein] methyl ester esterase [Permianibacter aggregans]TDQ49352.1 carboxylesterase BioH (pimeloyl-CoA synthesis) [Permianibacter aggregans]
MTLKPYVETEGQGPDLVLLHGWGLHAGLFDLIRVPLTKNYRVHFVDLPGFGRSPVAAGDYSLDYLRDQVLSIAPDNAHYVGWSLGGMVATAIALDYPQRVKSLVTVCSNPRFLQEDSWPHAMRDTVMENFQQFLTEDYEATLIRFLAISTMGSETQKEDMRYFKERVFIHGLPAPQALRGGLQLLKAVDLRPRLKELAMPFYRAYGRLDGLVPAKVADDVQQLAPNSEHYVFHKSSHAPFLSHRQEFLDVLNRWLA